ncbi:MAG: GxxExxY protein [Bacteroidota bacterium]
MKTRIDPRLETLTERIIGAAFEVSATLGHGFLESVYRKALLKQLSRAGLDAAQEVSYRITYYGEDVGHYVADLVVEGAVIVELKAVSALTAAHRAQTLNYVKASNLPVGLLLNFGTPRLEIKRVLL